MTTPATNNLSNRIASIFLRVGFPLNSIKFAIAQALHETGNKIEQPQETAGNNWSGITWINNSALQKNAVKGNIKPKKDWSNPNKPEYYAAFNSVDDWAIDFKRLISRNNGKQGRPIDATNVVDYVKRLKANAYFGDSEKNYLKALQYWMDKIIEMVLSNPAKTLVLLLIAVAIINS